MLVRLLLSVHKRSMDLRQLYCRFSINLTQTFPIGGSVGWL